MYHHMLSSGIPAGFTRVGLLIHIVLFFEVVYISKVFASIRSRGLKTTLVLVSIKLKSILELLMPQTIWGERVGLRPDKSSLTDAEIEQVYRWGRDEEILRWTAAPTTDLSLDDFRRQLRYQRWRPQMDQRSFYIVTRAGELIGKVILYSIDWTKGHGELGIFLDKNYWGKQYGRDATRMLIHYTFTKTPLNRIYLGTFRDNLRAQRSFAACGFRVVGVASKFSPAAGENLDGFKMEITRQDFQQYDW